MDFVLVTPPSSRLRKDQPAAPAQAAPVAQVAAQAPQPPRPTPSMVARPAATSAAATTAAQDVFRAADPAKPQGLAGVNRRWSPRASVEKPGWIGLANRDEPVPCTVCNASKHGAMIELATADAIGRPSDRLTDTFVLVWLNNRVRSEATCTVRWRSAKLLGVNFIGPVRTTVDRR